METQETPEPGNTRDPLWRPRSGNGKWRRDLSTVERDQRAAQLASKGWTYSEIAAELGYANRAGAYRAAQRCIYETAVEDGTTEELRRQQIEELRQLRQRMLAVLDNPPPAISRTGKVVVDDQGEPVPDAAAIVAAAAVIIRANERISACAALRHPNGP